MPNIPQNEFNNPPLIKLANLQPAIELDVKSMLTLSLASLHSIINPLCCLSNAIYNKSQRKVEKTAQTSQTISVNSDITIKTSKLEEMPYVITDHIRKSSQRSSLIAFLNETVYGSISWIEGTR